MHFAALVHYTLHYPLCAMVCVCVFLCCVMVPTDAIILDESVAKACAADTSSASLDSVQIGDSITIKVQSSKKSIMYKLSKVQIIKGTNYQRYTCTFEKCTLEL